MGPLREAAAAAQAGGGGSHGQGGSLVAAAGPSALRAAAVGLVELLSSPTGQAAAAAAVAAAERARVRQHPGPALDFRLPASTSAVPSALFLAQLLGQDRPTPATVAEAEADASATADAAGRHTQLVRAVSEATAPDPTVGAQATVQESAARAYTRVAEAARAFVVRRYSLQLDPSGVFVSALRTVDVLV
jgi:hypothetical protein